jgi:Carboxypeptidase regulatory-like domain
MVVLGSWGWAAPARPRLLGVPLSVVRVARPCALVLLLGAGLLFASTALVRPAEAAGSGSISGRVIDRDGQPVAGVTVSVRSLGGREAMAPATDDGGYFLADGLPPGQYAVCFYPEGEDLAKECWEDIEPATPHVTPVDVSDGQQVTGVDAVLLPYGRLRGTVTNHRGDPVAGVLVSATWRWPEDPDQPILCCESTFTAEDGSFQIGRLFSGEYKLQFSDTRSNRYATEWWDDAPTAAASTPVQLARGESAGQLDAVLADLAHITGRVTGADGSAASGATVRVFRVGSGWYPEIGTASSLAEGGRYEIALQPGTYRVAFDAAPGKYRTRYWKNARSVETARDVVITGTTSVTDLDGVLALAPPVQLTRRPTISGRALVGERLTVGHGEWDVPSLRFTYQWRADGVAIPRATQRRLLLTPKMRGTHISVGLTALATAHERSSGHATTRRTLPVGPTRS